MVGNNAHREEKIEIIHISDLHFGDPCSEKSGQRHRVLTSLTKKLAAEPEPSFPRVLAITGDIGWSGNSEDYKIAAAWIKQLLKTLKIPEKNLILCPGNHDINLKRAKAIAVPDNGAEADQMLTIDQLDTLSIPFRAYIDFCTYLGIPPLDIIDTKSHLTGVREIAGAQFLVLNSAWCFRGDEKKMWLGQPFLDAANAADQWGEKPENTIALFHHPESYLHDEEIRSYNNRLNTLEHLARGCSAILTGHLHGVPVKPNKLYNMTYIFNAGSAFETASSRNAFSILQWDRTANLMSHKHYEYDPADCEWEYSAKKSGDYPLRPPARAIPAPDPGQGAPPTEPSPDNKYTLIMEKLYQGSRRLYEIMTGKGGRFHFLKISDTLLTTARSSILWLDTHVSIDDKLPMNILRTLPQLWKMQNKHTVLTGDGGMGKTVSLLRWWQEYTKYEHWQPNTPIPLFIQLHEYNRWASNSDGANFILNQICKDYRHDSGKLDKEHLLDLFLHSIQKDSQPIPSVILLLDGFNEITAPDREPLYLEMQELLEKFPGLQIVVTSRYDMRETMNWQRYGVHLSHLLPLTDQQVSEYLDKQGILISQDNNHGENRLRELLKNPMMSTLYASTCEIERNHMAVRELTYKKPVRTVGELLWNFMESQAARFFDQYFGSKKFWYYRFLLRFLIPALGYEMEKRGVFSVTRKELKEIFEKYCRRLSGTDFFDAFPEYEKIGDNELFDFSCADNKRIRTQRELLEIITDELHMLVEDRKNMRFGDSYSFYHQNFQDFFAAMHIANMGALGIQKNEIPPELTEGGLNLYVRRMWGEMEGESGRKPIFSEERGWFFPEIPTDKNGLDHLLNACRGRMGHGPALAVWNILNTLIEVRGELSGADLTDLDLSKSPLNGVRCSRLFKNIYLAADFSGSRIDARNLLPQGHLSEIHSAVYSPDGYKILSVSRDNTIKEWYVATGECIRTYHDHEYWVNSAFYNKTGEKILSASDDKTIREWSTATGECLKIITGHEKNVRLAVYSPDETKILSVSSDKTIKEWSLETQKCLMTFNGHRDFVRSAFYSSDGKKVVSASDDHTIKEWDTATGECLKTYSGHTNYIRYAVYSPDGKKILSVSDDLTIREWRIATGECLKIYKGHNNSVKIAVYNRNGSKILSASSDKTIKEWSVQTGDCLRTYSGHSRNVRSAFYSEDERKILSASDDKTVKEWSVATGECMRIISGHDDSLRHAIKSPDGKKILMASMDKTIKEWSADTGECLRVYTGHNFGVRQAIYSKNGLYILSASDDRTIKEWSTATGECLRTFSGHKGSISSAIYSPDGAKILSASADHTIKEWLISTQKCVKTFVGHSDCVNSAIYSRDGATVLSASKDFSIKEWSAFTGECLITLEGHKMSVNSVFYHPNENKILSASRDRTIREWSTQSGECLRIINEFNNSVRYAEYSLKGDKILAESKDGVITILSSDTGQKLASGSYQDMEIKKEIADFFFNNGFAGAQAMNNEIRMDIASGRGLTRKNIPGLIIQGCSFLNLKAESVFSPDEIDIFRYYGGKISIEN